MRQLVLPIECKHVFVYPMGGYRGDHYLTGTCKYCGATRLDLTWAGLDSKATRFSKEASRKGGLMTQELARLNVLE